MTTAAEPLIQISDDSVPEPKGPSWHPLLKGVWQAINFILIGVVIFFAVVKGMEVREWAWWQSYHIHFRISLNNAMRWGYDANRIGLLDVYPEEIRVNGENLNQEPGDGRLALDYPPLRLFIAARWAAYAENVLRDRDAARIVADHRLHHKPDQLTKAEEARLDQLSAARIRQPRWTNDWRWVDDTELLSPMLKLNTLCEGAGAIGMFLLVHYWLRRCCGAPGRQWIDPLRCAWPALFAALLLWFSPAVIFSAHCYPQWDCYTLAPFLFAIYFGMLDLWLISGLLIGTVSMAKGQVLMVMPAIVIWQLLMMRPIHVIRQLFLRLTGKESEPLRSIGNYITGPVGAVLRLAAGIVLAIGVIASPWLVSNEMASSWVFSCGIALIWMLPLFFFRRWTWPDLLGSALSLLVASMFVVWPWHGRASPPALDRALEAIAVMAIAARFLPRTWIVSWAAIGMAGVLFACYPVFNTSMDWYTIGIKFPTEHWQLLYWCRAMNLGAILNHDYNWQFDGPGSLVNLHDYLWFVSPIWFERGNHFLALFNKTPEHGEAVTTLATLPIIPIRQLMIVAYLITMTMSAIGMAIQYRRRDRNFFFAMVAPWLLMYALLPQMQNRYSIWAAAFAASTAAFSVDGFMLFLLLNAINFLDTALDMFYRSQNTPSSEKYLPLVMPLFPDLGWMVLLLAGIYLYLALRKDRRKPLIDPSSLATQSLLLLHWLKNRSHRRGAFELIQPTPPPPAESQQPEAQLAELVPA